MTGKSILITGGSGTFGQAMVRYALDVARAARVVVVSRGEHRQAALKAAFPNEPRLECWIGDVRDQDRMRWACESQPDVLIHAAALKRVEVCEADPDEAVKTNVMGTRAVVHEAMRANIPKVLVVSSDKACDPATIYGSTKAAAEAVALGANAWRGKRATRVSVVRYGNILGSQGSVLDRFYQSRVDGSPVPITDLRCTRYWWSIDDAVAFVGTVIERMRGAEIWIPRLASSRVVDLARAIAPESPLVEVGTRGPEKLHESMIGATESPYAWALPDGFVILPKEGYAWSPAPPEGAVRVPPGFTYSSDQDPSEVTACVS